MSELVENAWGGWQNFIADGKLAALLLAALLVLWFGGKALHRNHAIFVIYTTIMTFCCICPLTAALLMAYQTRFYDYQWTWSVVPMTALIAMTGTLLWTEWTDKLKKDKGALWKCVGITALMVAVIYLCGNLRNNIIDWNEEAAKQEKTARVIEVLTEDGTRKGITLWAPQEIMEFARAVDGNIYLPYGLNMWDDTLDTYSYDIYGEKEQYLYDWMCSAEKSNEQKAQAQYPTKEQTQTLSGTTCAQIARELEINCILLPGSIEDTKLQEMENALGVEAASLEEYYLLWLDN